MVTSWQWSDKPLSLEEEGRWDKRFLGYDKDTGKPVYVDEFQKTALTPWEWYDWYYGGKREAYENYLRQKLSDTGKALDLDAQAVEDELKSISARTTTAKALEDNYKIVVSGRSEIVDLLKEKEAEIERMEAELDAYRLARDGAALIERQREYDTVLAEYHALEKAKKSLPEPSLLEKALEAVKEFAKSGLEKSGEAQLRMASPEYTEGLTYPLRAAGDLAEAYQKYVPGTIGGIAMERMKEPRGLGDYLSTIEKYGADSVQAQQKREEMYQKMVQDATSSMPERVAMSRDEFNRFAQELPLPAQVLLYAVFDPLTYATFGGIARAATLPVRAIVPESSRAALIAKGIIEAGQQLDYAFTIPIQAFKWLIDKGYTKIAIKIAARLGVDESERKIIRQATEATADAANEALRTAPKTQLIYDNVKGSWYFKTRDRVVYVDELVKKPETQLIYDNVKGSWYFKTRDRVVYVNDLVKPEKPGLKWKLVYRDGRWGFDIYYPDGTMGWAEAPMFNPPETAETAPKPHGEIVAAPETPKAPAEAPQEVPKAPAEAAAPAPARKPSPAAKTGQVRPEPATKAEPVTRPEPSYWDDRIKKAGGKLPDEEMVQYEAARKFEAVKVDVPEGKVSPAVQKAVKEKANKYGFDIEVFDTDATHGVLKARTRSDEWYEWWDNIGLKRTTQEMDSLFDKIQLRKSKGLPFQSLRDLNEFLDTGDVSLVREIRGTSKGRPMTAEEMAQIKQKLAEHDARRAKLKPLADEIKEAGRIMNDYTAADEVREAARAKRQELINKYLDALLTPEHKDILPSKTKTGQKTQKSLTHAEAAEKLKEIQQVSEAARALARNDTEAFKKFPADIRKKARNNPQYADIEITKLATLVGVPLSTIPAAAETEEGRPPPLWTAVPIGVALAAAAAGRPKMVAALSKEFFKKAAPVFPKTETIIKQRLRPDWLRKVSEAIGGKPVGKQIIGIINPSGRVQDEVAKAVIVRTEIMERGRSLKNVMMSPLRMQQDPVRLFGITKGNIVTKVQAEEGASLAWGDVFQAALTGKYKLTPAQKEYVETVYAFEDAVADMLRKEGIEINKLSLADGMHYVARRLEKPSFAASGKVNIGKKMSSEHERIYEYMSEGLLDNIPYIRDPNRVMEEMFDAAVRRIADKRLAEMILPMGSTKKTYGMAPMRHPIFARHAAFAGRFFPEDVVRELDKLLGDAGNSWIRTAGAVSGVMRLLQATLDFSAPFIQGIPVLARRPDIWAKATLRHYETFLDPRAFQMYLSRNSNEAIRAVTDGGLYLGEHEYFAGTETIDRLLAKLPGSAGDIAKGIGQETFGRFGASFSSFGDIARLEMWKALSPRFIGKEQELGAFLNRMTGVLSSKALGIGLTQREFENAWMFFAPRYTRAGFALIADIFRSGRIGDEARLTFTSMIAGGMAMYIGMCKALGQEPHINPFTDGAKFMSIKAGDTYVGIGGMMTSLVRLAGDIGYAVSQEDRMERFLPTKKPDEPLEHYITRVRQDQPFVKFWLSKAAPLTGTTVNLIEGRDYLGEPLETPQEYLGYILSQGVPMGLKGGFEGGFDPERMALSEIGLRTWPMSPADMRDRRREQLAALQGKTWDEIPRLEQMKMEQSDPELKKWTEEAKTRQTWRAGLEQMTKQRMENDRELAVSRFSEAVRLAAKEVTDRQSKNYGDYTVFRKKIQDAGKVVGDRYDEIYSRPEVVQLVEKWRKLAKEKIAELEKSGLAQPIQDAAYDEYMTTILLADDLEDEYGNYLIEVAEERLKEFKERWGEDIWKYIQERRTFGKDLPPEYWDYLEARDKLKPYWQLREATMKVIERKYPGARKRLEAYQKLSQFMSADDMAATRRKYPEIDAFNRLLEYTQDKYRVKYPEIDAALVKYYGYKPISLQSR